MGYSFDTTRHYPRENLQQSGRSGCRTRWSYLPRSALSNQSEDIDLIREYLKAAPSQGLVSSAAELPTQERSSGLSRTDSQGKKRALNVLSLPSNPIRRLLRSRSTSPAPYFKKNVAQQATTKGVRYCQIVQDLESLTKLENPSASRVNCHGIHKLSGSTPVARAAEVDRVPCTTGIAVPAGSFKEMLGPESQFVDLDGLGWAKEHPQWLPIQQRSSSPRHEPFVSKGDTQAKPNSSPRHNVGSIARDFASKETTTPIERGNAENVERLDPGRSFGSLGKEAQTNQQWTPMSSNMRPSYNTDTGRQTNAALSDGSRIYSSLRNITSGQLSKQGTSSPKSSGPGSTVEENKSTPHNSPCVVVAEGSTSDTSSSVRMDAQVTCPTNTRQPTDPGPAPVGPLPPIPNGCGSGSSKSPDSGRDTYSTELGTGRPLTTVSEKSSARDRHPTIDPFKKSKSTSLPKRIATVPDFDQEWPRPPTFRPSRDTIYPRNSESPMSLALIDEDPFGFQRHIEKSAARRVKKSATAKRRHLEDTRNHEGTSGVENSGTRDGKPNREGCEAFMVPLPRGKQGPDVSDPCVGIGKQAQHVDDLETTERPSEQKGRPQDIETIVRYRNRSTQFSPQKRQILVSPPGSPRPPSPEEGRDWKEKMAQSSGTRHSCNSCHAAPADALNTEKPDSLAWYLADLESRLESRLKVFERRTVLLEAALLAVINASANLGVDERSSDIDRSSRISGCSEKVTPLEAKLEAMVRVMQATRNPSADI